MIQQKNSCPNLTKICEKNRKISIEGANVPPIKKMLKNLKKIKYIQPNSMLPSHAHINYATFLHEGLYKLHVFFYYEKLRNAEKQGNTN